MGDRAQIGNTTSPPMTRGGATLAAARGMGTYQRRSKTKPILAPYVQKDGAFGTQTNVDLQARLYEESVGWPNLANDPQVVKRAQEAVQAGLQDTFNGVTQASFVRVIGQQSSHCVGVNGFGMHSIHTFARL